MAERPNTPPAATRLDLTPRELEQVCSVTGPLSADLAITIRDGRGRKFQRLEFLGDSVLDVLVSTHALVEPSCPVCAAATGGVADVVSDERLARQADDVGLGAWLEWTPSAQRLADLTESCVAAGWLSGGWAQAAEVAVRLVHPLGPECVDVLLGGTTDRPADGCRRVQARLGASLLELAAGWMCYREHPDADEGELSRLRAVVHQVSRVAFFARRSHLAAVGSDAEVSDQVEVWLAEAAVLQGADSALAHAEGVLT